MQCDCIKKVEEKAKVHLQPSVKAPITDVSMGNVAFVIRGNKMETSMFFPLYVKADAPGYRSAQGKQVPMHVSFCPFCGKSAKAEEPVT